MRLQGDVEIEPVRHHISSVSHMIDPRYVTDLNVRISSLLEPDTDVGLLSFIALNTEHEVSRRIEDRLDRVVRWRICCRGEELSCCLVPGVSFLGCPNATATREHTGVTVF